MTQTASRRAFLRGQFSQRRVMRPLGALAPEAFARACTGCMDCAEACPEGIIITDSDNLPVIDLRLGACTFCGDCLEACETGALDADTPWDWKATVTDDCLSLNGVSCRTCEDQCDEQALRFRLMTGGRAQPIVDPELCRGCGACAAACPAGAVTFTHQDPRPDLQHDGVNPC